MSQQRTRVAILFGGRSGEHSISCATAAGVLAAIDRERFEPVPIGITPQGQWVPVDDDWSALALQDGQGASISARSATLSLAISSEPDQPGAELISMTTPQHTLASLGRIDVAMPLLHGAFGEDGTIQGMLETVGLPYTGCGVLASAVAMDKAVTKTLMRAAGLPVGPWRVITDADWQHRRELALNACRELSLPVFVKPARGGSSLGVGRVDRWEDLAEAALVARNFDPKVIVEQATAGREVECAVLGSAGGADPRVALPGEIIVHHPDAVYDFESKYVDDQAVTLQVPAQIPPIIAGQLQDYAKRAFVAISGEGLARVDFFYDEAGDHIFLNEINTMPGLTPRSLYPAMWQAAGLSYQDLVSELIDLALSRPCGLR